MNANPPLEVALAAITATFATQAGHITKLFLSCGWPCSFSPDTQPDDRAIAPRTSDIPRPIARPALRASLPTAFRGRGHSGGVEAAPLSRAPANASTPPAATSRAAGPDQSHTDRREQGGRGCGAGSGRPARQRFDSTFLANI